MDEQAKAKHPLDESDQFDCYQTMMSERTALITAQRESENNLVKTIIQLSTTMIVLTAGFSTQSERFFDGHSLWISIFALVFLVIATMAVLFEHWFSSTAYKQQQKSLVDFYTKQVHDFIEAPANRYVRWAQLVALVAFTIAIALVGTLAVLQLKERSIVGRVTAATATAASASRASKSWRYGQIYGQIYTNSIGSSVDAAASSEKISKQRRTVMFRV